MQPDKPDEIDGGDQPPDTNATLEDAQRQAAANVARGQVNSAYDRTHAPESQLSTTEHFRQYHSAWQNYYQKYYENYYTAAVRQTAEQLRQQSGGESAQPGAVFSQPVVDSTSGAVKNLQASLKKTVRERAGKVRRSRHFWPLITAFSIAGVFLFLQYNRLLIANVAAYVSPGSVDPQNIIIDPTTDTKVGPDPLLIIPKINVDAPVIYTVATYDNNLIEQNLKNGVVKYPIPGANALPGQVGNLVIGGHSSNDVFDDGNYKFVFVQLEKMVVGDTFYLNYQGTRYTYHVTKTATIEPDQINVLTAPVTTPTVTLITCTPVGTALHRFIVVAEQVSPDPSGAASANNQSQSTDSTIPGNSPTLLQRIFGG